MSFKIEDYSVLIKCNEAWNKIKGMLGIKFYSKSADNEKNIKTKVKAFNGGVHTIFASVFRRIQI